MKKPIKPEPKSTSGAAKKKEVKRNVRKSAKVKEPSVSESDIQSNPAFKEANSKAERYAKDPERLKKLFEDATKKSQSIPKGPFAETWAYLLAMIRLVRAYYKGEYREISNQSFILILVAVIYFVSPIDLIPDWIPVLGLIDDAFVVGLALKSVRGELDDFMEWETRKA